MDCNIQKGVVDPSANYVRDMSDKYLSRTWATFLVGIASVKWGNETLFVCKSWGTGIFIHFMSLPAGIHLFKVNNRNNSAMCKICLKLTIKAPNDVIDFIVVSLLLTLNIFHKLFWCFYCWLWTSKWQLCWSFLF